jgi:hypothetical protein
MTQQGTGVWSLWGNEADGGNCCITCLTCTSCVTVILDLPAAFAYSTVALSG